MEIRSAQNANLNVNLSANLNAIAGVPSAPPVSSYEQADSASDASEFPSLDGDWATLSTTGSSLARASGDAGVRSDKVDTIRSAIAAGTYAVPAHAVAGRAIGTMLGQGV